MQVESVPRKPSFSFKNTADGWKVEIPASLSTSGKRERAFFKTRDAARNYAQEMEERFLANGGNNFTIKPSLAEAATQAETILAPTGATLLEAARDFVRRWNENRASKAFNEAVAEYLDARADLRESTLSSYRYTLEKVFFPLHDEMLADLTVGDMQLLLAKKGPTATRMHRANLRAFWRWAAKAPRAWCKAETVDAIEAVRSSNDSDIAILDPEDAGALLRAAEIEGPAAAVSYAICIFAGVRMAELGKLTWGFIGPDHIEIGKAISKKHSRRLIPVCPTLKAWFKAYRGKPEKDDPVTPPNWLDVSKSVRRRAGWKVAARLLPEEVLELQTPRGPWPANACRHTCASVQVAIGTPLEELTFKFGHSGGHDLLRRHYVSRLTKKDAMAILALGPEGKTIKFKKSR